MIITRRRAVAPTTVTLSALSIALSAALALSGCGTSTAPTQSSPRADASSASADGCITDFDATTDYFPVKQKLEYADNFTLSYNKSYQVLTVKQPVVGGKPESYVLLKCGAPKPQLTGALASAPVITTPVTSIFSASTTHIPSLEALGKLDLITGVATKSYISSKAAQQRVSGSSVTEFAPAGTTDAEKVVAAKPEVLITAGTDDPAYATIRKAGIPVLADADFLEDDPLGRAEWIKYFAALTGTEQQATTTFDKISSGYDALVAKAKGATPKQLLVSQPYQGTWSMPAGGSYAGRLLTDAGGAWPWQSTTSSGSVSADTETVLDKSGKAKIWINTSNWKSKAEALKEEPRFTNFAAFSSGQVWSPSLQVNAAGGNNYFELGVLRPDLIEADLIAIIHPDLLPDHQFTFYRKLS